MDEANASHAAPYSPSTDSPAPRGRDGRKAAHQRQTDAQDKEDSKEPTFSGLSKILWDADSLEEARKLAAAKRGDRNG